MYFAKLIVVQPGRPSREFEIVGDRLTIGRALDNTISLEGDTNVSRYHAEIERRGDTFRISDLGSSNGTTVNDKLVDFEQQLKDGDLISTGGSTVIEFQLSTTRFTRQKTETRTEQVKNPASLPATAELPPVEPSQIDYQTPVRSTQTTSGPRLNLLLVGVGAGLVVTALVAVIIYALRSPDCRPTARIVYPQSGTVREPTTIRVEVESQECIDRLIYQLNGKKIASAEGAPYEITIAPEMFRELGGGNHILSVTVEDLEGNKTLQNETVLLAFDQGDKGSTPTAGQDQTGDESTSEAGTASVSDAEVKEMAVHLAQRINPNNQYIFDSGFLQQVRLRSTQYVSSGPLERARGYRDMINEAFVGEYGLPASLGYVMALSRSRFALDARNNSNGTSSGESDQPQGLWQIQPSLARTPGYLGRCGTNATLNDADQKCASTVAAAYTKALVLDLFRGDFVYAVATFSMPSDQAVQFRDQLPADRRDFWKVIKSGPQRERVVNFFAAGIVGENPQRFGLVSNLSLTNLY
ncbi:MAG TPA: FHA domain-containing protein [Pyrinomonadaceae bacterium]|nr:FHA domain-containing protein [Pyrinomonadaceae bacterium]